MTGFNPAALGAKARLTSCVVAPLTVMLPTRHLAAIGNNQAFCVAGGCCRCTCTCQPGSLCTPDHQQPLTSIGHRAPAHSRGAVPPASCLAVPTSHALQGSHPLARPCCRYVCYVTAPLVVAVMARAAHLLHRAWLRAFPRRVGLHLSLRLRPGFAAAGDSVAALLLLLVLACWCW
jgi:hypothetical protein